jgi:hypothetical protein
MDTRGAASGAFTAQAVADGETAGRPELDLDELRKAEAGRRRMLDNLPVRRPFLFHSNSGYRRQIRTRPSRAVALLLGRRVLAGAPRFPLSVRRWS